MVSLVTAMLNLHKQRAAVRTADEKTAIQRIIDATDKEIDRAVYSCMNWWWRRMGLWRGRCYNLVTYRRTERVIFVLDT